QQQRETADRDRQRAPDRDDRFLRCGRLATGAPSPPAGTAGRPGSALARTPGNAWLSAAPTQRSGPARTARPGQAGGAGPRRSAGGHRRGRPAEPGVGPTIAAEAVVGAIARQHSLIVPRRRLWLEVGPGGVSGSPN